MPLLRCCFPYKYSSLCCSTSPPPSPSPYPSSVSFGPLPPQHRRCPPPHRPLLPLCSLESEIPEDDDNDIDRSNRGRGIPPRPGEPRLVLVERRRDGTAKRYVLDDKSELQTYWKGRQSSMNVMIEEECFSDLSWIPDIFKNFILPAGFPGSVSEDYLDYMLLQFPTNVTGWVCHTLVTSSLLKAVGIGTSAGTSAAAAAAAIRWVSKDGLGAIGRLVVGGRFGNLFDDDPKQWRMYADIIGSTGSIFELSTQLYPAYFLPLASLGNLAKAIARGLKDPSFRVIQNHFAMSANLGEVAAKEEVWEVAAQLLGLFLGVLVMDTPGVQTSYSMMAFIWLSVRLLHLRLRYQSLSVLKFHTINLKRARILVKSHVVLHTVPGYADCNKEENILSWERFVLPRVIFGVSLDRMIGREGSSHMVKALLRLYMKEKYILFVNQCGSRGLEFLITFKVGATGLSVLKSLWQVYWLHEQQGRLPDHVFSWLEESLLNLEDGFADFLKQLEEAGWDKHRIGLNVPNGLLFEEIGSIELSYDK
ncbi:protein root UVB sensitive 5 isoform X2 [Elaeis guineensis]|uniref:Protein root UVB sensitive 5 isoform X2 n=1 Tax=Elaeis guineensis var. tenera TaxID=51953 RepID=A0A6I9QEA4_ELAGV|nr:protein root UVB sensitive 5 isoform X2 [Elaeis guineensis]